LFSGSASSQTAFHNILPVLGCFASIPVRKATVFETAIDAGEIKKIDMEDFPQSWLVIPHRMAGKCDPTVSLANLLFFWGR
jgi:hypothetical protein